MISKNKIIALIPARSGSRGLKNKNIIKLNNIPLIAWTIKSALKSKKIDKILIDSDSKKILNISKKFNTNSFIIHRPKKLALDKTPISDVIINSLSKFKEEYETFILLQPTSPFRSSKHIDEFIDYYIKSKTKFLVSISSSDKPKDWYFNINKKNEKIKLKIKNYKLSSNRQSFKDTYYINGLLYMANIRSFLNTKSFINKHTEGYIINGYQTLDIDRQNDLEYAKYLIQTHNIKYE